MIHHPAPNTAPDDTVLLLIPGLRPDPAPASRRARRITRATLRAAVRTIAAELNPLARPSTFGTTVALAMSLLALPATQLAPVAAGVL